MSEQRVRLWDEYWQPLYDSEKDSGGYSHIVAEYDYCNVRFEAPGAPIYVGKLRRDGSYVPWGYEV